MPRKGPRLANTLLETAAELAFASPVSAVSRLSIESGSGSGTSAVTLRSRIERMAMLDALVAHWLGLDLDDLVYVLRSCDFERHDAAGEALDPKGFWRVDKHLDPELRRTVLAILAFQDLQSTIRTVGDEAKGIDEFLRQNAGDGWTAPERLRLSDHGLGHSSRSRERHLVAGRLGPRLLDWQLVQTCEERSSERHLHTRNQLGTNGYSTLIDEISGRESRHESGDQRKPVPLRQSNPTPRQQPAELRGGSMSIPTRCVGNPACSSRHTNTLIKRSFEYDG